MQTVNNQLAVATVNGTFFYGTGDILRLEASSNYTRIYLANNKKIITAKVLKEFAAILEPMGFVRIHRSHLVNPQYIFCVDNSGTVIMKDNSVAEISRRLKSGVMRTLKSFTAVA